MVSRLSVVARSIVVIALTVLALIWIGQPAGAVEPAALMGAMTYPCAYDAPTCDSPGAEATSGRGPPAACRSCTIYDVGRRSHDASPRPDASPGRPITTCDYPVALVQVARATTTTGGRVGLTEGGSSSLERSGVAAKSEASLLARASAARDAELARLTGLRSADRPATVVGAYNVRTGNVAVGQSSKALMECAEACAARNVGGDIADIRFTIAKRPNGSGPPFRDIPVCSICESTHGRGAFPDPATDFRSDLP